MKAAVLACIVMLALGLSAVDAAPKAAPKQPKAKEPVAKKAKEGKGKCKSGRFLVLDKPLLPFSKAAAACAKAGKKLSTIDAIFGGTDAKLMDAAKAALVKCIGSDRQAWYDTTLTKKEKPSTCTALTSVLAPKDGSAKVRKAGGATVILPTTVLGGCNAKLPVLCM